MKYRIISLILCLIFLASFRIPVSANNTKLIALTFDDGPVSAATPKLLDALAERNVKVTFFLIGKNIEYCKSIAERASAEGHQLCNHSYSHTWFTSMSSSGIKSEVEKTNLLIAEISGVKCRFVRVPYGDINANVKASVNAPIIQWSVDPGNGSMYLSEKAMINNLLKQADDGSIVILHDVNQKNLNVAISAIDELLDQGYEFVTLDELFRLRGITPKNGTVYYSVPKNNAETQYNEAKLEEHWAHEYIDFVSETGIMEGSSSGFKPNCYLTRAMAATILWRMADCPTVDLKEFSNSNSYDSSYITSFTDVSTSSWYAKAVAWSFNNQIINGTSSETFSPDTYITKEEFYTLLARFGNEKLSEAPKVQSPAIYRDDVHISSWAKESVSLFRYAGFKSQNDPQIFRPLDYVTRAEAAELITWLLKDCTSK